MNWNRVEPPKRKADWRYKHLRLLATPPPARYDFIKNEPIPVACKPGDVARIYMRRHVRELSDSVPYCLRAAYGARLLELDWECPHCMANHTLYIPKARRNLWRRQDE